MLLTNVEFSNIYVDLPISSLRRVRAHTAIILLTWTECKLKENPCNIPFFHTTIRPCPLKSCLDKESKILLAQARARKNTGGDFKYALNQVSCLAGGVPKFLSVLSRLEAIREKFQSVIPVLR